MKTFEEKKAETERLLALLPEVREELSRIPGVVRVTVGIRERGGALTDQIVFRVHVEQKLPESALAPGDIVPKSIRGVPVDVIVKRLPVLETGFNDENDTKKYRPVTGGVSISPENANPDVPGTLGCFCRRTTDSKTVFVTNWHVLVDPGGGLGDGVGQPKWRKTSCCVCDRIGTVLDFDQALDCAIAELGPSIAFAPKIRRILRPSSSTVLSGRIAGSGVPIAGDDVYKVGRRTGLTRGMITDVDPVQSRVEISPDPGFPRMSAGGDSGSVYVSRNTADVVVLHNAGDGVRGFGTPFNLVKARLNIEVIPTPDDVSFAVIETAHDDVAKSEESMFQQLADRLQQTAAGGILLHIIETHRDEIMDLIAMRRRVTVTWHRVEGPAFLAAFLRSAQDDAYVIPGDVRSVSRSDAVSYMAAALRATGGVTLRADIDAHGERISSALIESNTVSEMLALLDAALLDAALPDATPVGVS